MECCLGSASIHVKSPYRSLSSALVGFPADAADPSLPGLYRNLNVRKADLSKESAMLLDVQECHARAQGVFLA